MSYQQGSPQPEAPQVETPQQGWQQPPVSPMNQNNQNNQNKKKSSFSWKTFLTAFCGALVACVLALGVYSVVAPGSSTVLGGQR